MLVINLSKAKALPVGTKRKNPDGSWRVKTSRGWKYYPKGKLPKKYKVTTKKKSSKKDSTNKPTSVWNELTMTPRKDVIFDNIGRDFFEFISDKAKVTDKEREFIKNKLGIRTAKGIVSILKNKSKFSKFAQNVSDLVVREPLSLDLRGELYDLVETGYVLHTPNFEENIKVSTIYISKTSKNAMSVSFSIKNSLDSYSTKSIDVPIHLAEDFINKWVTDDVLRKLHLSRLKKTTAYIEWKINNDKRLKKAIDDFEKTTGLKLNTMMDSKKISITPSRIKQLQKYFTEIGKYINLKKYVPPDDRKLKVALIKSTKNAAGTYTEYDTTINISPSAPGTITHEIGHYFYHRDKRLQRDFIKWANDVGLIDKINKTLKGGFTKQEYNKFVDLQYVLKFGDCLNDLNETFEKYKIGSPIKGDYLETFNFVATFLVEKIKDESPNKISLLYSDNKMEENIHSIFNLLKTAKVKDLRKIASNLATKFPEWKKSPSDIYLSLSNIKKDKHKNEILDKMADVYIRNVFNSIREDWRRKGSIVYKYNRFYTSRSSYWKDYNEMFARSFRNYIAMKAGKPLFRTIDETRKNKTVKEEKADPFGWDFPEVSPQEDMLKKGFDKLIKKYLGSKVVKSIINVLEETPKTKMVILLKGMAGIRGVPDGSGPEGKGATGRRKGNCPKREDYSSDEEYEEAMDEWKRNNKKYIVKSRTLSNGIFTILKEKI